MNRVRTPLIALALVMAASGCQLALPAPVSAPVQTSSAPVLTSGASNPSETPTRQIPTAMASQTLTPFPSITSLPPTPTNTPFGFVPSKTPTPIFIAPPAPPGPEEGATNEYGSPYRCALMNKDPFDWAEVSPKKEVKITWTFINTGTKTWKADDVVIAWESDARLVPPDHKRKLISEDVKPGQETIQFMNIWTPELPGHYRSVWALKEFDSGTTFCTFTIKITVR